MTYDNSIEKKNKQLLNNSKNGFYSLCRKVSNYEATDNELINFYTEKIKNMFLDEKMETYYLKVLDFLRICIFKNKLTPEDAIIVSFKCIDPDFEMYQIYEEYSNMYDIKEAIKKEFNFYDEKYLTLEKNYIKYNNLEDEYSFEKKLI